VFVVDGQGVHEYKPGRHVLRRHLAGDLRGKLSAAALDQPSVGAAPLCLVITMDMARSASKYGKRAKRYWLLEAGHVAQNVLPQATALDLSGVPIGAFEDRKVATVLGLRRNFRPVYLVPLGHPPGR
jgi:SagB-type dehydrogenase family enzyme